MQAGMRQMGRKANTYRSTWGELIDGLSLRSDGYFHPTGKGSPTFGKDETAAIQRFRIWAGKKQQPEDLYEFNSGLGNVVAATQSRIVELIETQPAEAALQLGIPALGRMPTSPGTVKLATLAMRYGNEKRGRQGQQLDPKYRKNLISYWIEFLAIAGNPRTTADVNRSHIQAFRKFVFDKFDKGKVSATYVRQRFASVKALFQFGIDHTDDKAEFRRLLDECGNLTAPADSATNSRPISRAEFETLLQHADSRMRAILLLGLNSGLHNGECAALQKSEINLTTGALTALRPKGTIILDFVRILLSLYYILYPYHTTHSG